MSFFNMFLDGGDHLDAVSDGIREWSNGDQFRKGWFKGVRKPRPDRRCERKFQNNDQSRASYILDLCSFHLPAWVRYDAVGVARLREFIARHSAAQGKTKDFSFSWKITNDLVLFFISRLRLHSKDLISASPNLATI